MRTPLSLVLRPFVLLNGFPVIAHDGPVVLPFQGLQMHDASGHAHVLEMHEESLSFGCLHPSSLVRRIDGGIALRERHFQFVGAVYVLAPLHHLPAGSDTSGRVHDIVIPVAFVEFRSFAGGVLLVSVEDDPAGSLDRQTVRRQFRHHQYGFQPEAATCYAVTQPYASVLVP